MVYILLGQGFEELEALAPCDILRRCGVEVRLAGITKQVTGGHGITVLADVTVEEIQQDQLDMVVLPGGLGGVESLGGCPVAMEAVKTAFDAGKYVAAICAGPTLLGRLGLVEGRRVTSYPGTEPQLTGAIHTGKPVEVDGRLITGQGAGSAVAFGLKLAEILCGQEPARRVAQAMVVQ